MEGNCPVSQTLELEVLDCENTFVGEEELNWSVAWIGNEMRYSFQERAIVSIYQADGRLVETEMVMGSGAKAINGLATGVYLSRIEVAGKIFTDQILIP